MTVNNLMGKVLSSCAMELCTFLISYLHVIVTTVYCGYILSHLFSFTELEHKCKKPFDVLGTFYGKNSTNF